MAIPYAFIFGYGSLVELASRTSTAASARDATPAVVRGIKRGWPLAPGSWN